MWICAWRVGAGKCPHQKQTEETFLTPATLTETFGPSHPRCAAAYSLEEFAMIVGITKVPTPHPFPPLSELKQPPTLQTLSPPGRFLVSAFSNQYGSETCAPKLQGEGAGPMSRLPPELTIMIFSGLSDLTTALNLACAHKYL